MHTTSSFSWMFKRCSWLHLHFPGQAWQRCTSGQLRIKNWYHLYPVHYNIDDLNVVVKENNFFFLMGQNLVNHINMSNYDNHFNSFLWT